METEAEANYQNLSHDHILKKDQLKIIEEDDGKSVTLIDGGRLTSFNKLDKGNIKI
jgi:hypothetical protein